MTKYPKLRIASADLWYPRADGDGCTNAIDVHLMDVRAADDIRIQYDFDRDGYSITREKTIDRGGAMECTGEWIEVAFIPSWSDECVTKEAEDGDV